MLAHTVADSPGMILQKLAETALQLCRADTAGISLLSGAIQKPYHIDEVLKKIETASVHRTILAQADCQRVPERNNS